MNFLEKVMEKWNTFMAKAKPVLATAKDACAEVGRIVKIGAGYVIKMRKIFLAIPVAWGAIYLAVYNEAHLPAVVGLNLQTSGEFNLQVIRELAVLGPVVITGVCLVLMLCSRRLLTPWLVSMFSLLLPVFILITNTFPV